METLKFVLLLCLFGISFATQDVTIIRREHIHGFFKNISLYGMGQVSADVDQFTDKIIANVDMAMLKYLEPMYLNDIHLKLGIGPFAGKSALTNGTLYDISTLHREGDAIVTYFHSNQSMILTIPIGFDALKFKYHYNTKWMGLGPTGEMGGNVMDMKMRMKLLFDIENYEASLVEYSVIKAGVIDVYYEGNPLIDWLFDGMTGAFVFTFRPVILGIVEHVVRGTTVSVLDALNKLVNDFLHKTHDPTTSTSTIASNYL